ncbi:MAG: NAD(P)/FAD-dependent oxidoreductase [Pikeienuella sp.]
MEQIETVVIGAGVIGLAVARALALTGREVLILEAEDQFGSVTSARNSEVIHAGIYYAKDSLKAQLCVAGKVQLYAYCASRKIGHRNCGKLVVATSDEDLAQLEAIAAKARANGVDDVAVLSTAEAQAMEPALQCLGALWSPSTGIVDTHGLMLSLLGEAEEAGAMLALNAPVDAVSVQDGFLVEVGGPTPMKLAAKEVINAAGLNAPDLAKAFLPEAHVPQSWMARGCYFKLMGRAPFDRLIYPVPAPGGLGVHLTLDHGGQVRFGPDVEWIDEVDYTVDPKRGDAFYAEVRKYWPDLPDGALSADYAGIRPKLSPPGAAAADFVFSGPADHGVPGYLGLYGFESPGLTSCLAIADYSVAKLSE